MREICDSLLKMNDFVSCKWRPMKDTMSDILPIAFKSRRKRTCQNSRIGWNEYSHLAQIQSNMRVEMAIAISRRGDQACFCDKCINELKPDAPWSVTVTTKWSILNLKAKLRKRSQPKSSELNVVLAKEAIWNPSLVPADEQYLANMIQEPLRLSIDKRVIARDLSNSS